MEIKPRIGLHTVYASDYLKLDSNVNTGGGTDETEIVQAILDKALEWGELVLEMDGAALVSRLTIHSNTTIHCANKACGFFQKGGVNNSMITNSAPSLQHIATENITLLGGTYNFNNYENGRMDCTVEELGGHLAGVWVGVGEFDPQLMLHNALHFNFGLKFLGVRHLTIRDVRTVNQAVYAICITCFEHVVIEDVFIDLPHCEYAHNQDGIHLYGPGKDAYLHNISGRSGDDFIAIASDEWDQTSAVTDVLIDGVCLHEADQGIHLLSRDKGRLDRITVRNVYGTYKSFGFYVGPWYGLNMGEGEGNMGHVTFENIRLEPTYHKYSAYDTPMLFRVNGRIDSITMKDIQWNDPNDNRVLMDVGGYMAHPTDEHTFAKIGLLKMENWQVFNRRGTKKHNDYVCIDGDVDRLIMRQIEVDREGNENDDVLLRLRAGAHIKDLVLSQVMLRGAGEMIAREDGSVVEREFIDNIYTEE